MLLGSLLNDILNKRSEFQDAAMQPNEQPKSATRRVLHIDMDAFFASVEVVRDPGEGEGSFATVRAATRRAWRVLRRRWAALLVLAAVFLGGTLVVSIGMSPMGMYTGGVLDSSFAAWCGLQAVSYLVQIAVLSVVHLAFYAALTALARDTAAATGPTTEPEAA